MKCGFLAAIGLIGSGVLLVLPACSVADSLDSASGPDFSAVRKGASRREVESQLGKPVRRQGLERGYQRNTYRFVPRDSPDLSDRLLAKGMMEVLSIGTWGILEEGAHRHEINDLDATVVYDSEGKVIAVEKLRPSGSTGGSDDEALLRNYGVKAL